MWPILDSLQPLVDVLAPAFTTPSFVECQSLLLGWVMCLRRKTLRRIGDNQHPDSPPDHRQRHGLDRLYNFFERSAWTPDQLAYSLGVLILTRLNFSGGITLLVDDTLLHKTGQCVWGLGWFRDAVASTRKRVATASGHNWVVLAIAVCHPADGAPIFALPLMARLHRPGTGQPSCPALVREMLQIVRDWFPERRFTVVGDGAFATKVLLRALPERMEFVGRLRGDAAVYDPRVPRRVQGRRGRPATKGPRRPSPKEAARKADRQRSGVGEWVWQTVPVQVYGRSRALQVVRYEVVWPHVLGGRRIQVVVVRDPSGAMDDIYLFTTDLHAGVDWAIGQFAWRWSIEVVFRASKQTLEIEAPQHWCQSSVEKVAPWVWSMQSVIVVWYLTAGRELPEARDRCARMGDWDSEWSLRHMVEVLRSVILNTTFDTNSADRPQLVEMVNTLKSWGNMAA